jgi:hypothetical protein
MDMRYLVIGMLMLVLAPFAAAQNADPWGRGNLERELQDSYSRQRQRDQQQNYDQERQQQQRQQQSYEQERQRSYQQERQQQEQRYEQEKRQSAEDAVRRERAIQSERRGEPAPGRSIYQFGK